MKTLTPLICVIILWLTLTGCGSEELLYVYAPVDYVNDELVDAFKAETGITVKYDLFESNEAMYTDIKHDAAARYDIVMPSDYMIERMRKEGMLEKLDKNNIPNVSNIDDMFRDPIYDPTGEYSVAYMWGTVGIMYNADYVEEEPTSWSILWDERYKKKVFMLNSVRDSIGLSLRYLGYSLNTINMDELNAAKAKLIEQKPVVLSYETDTIKDKMIAGEGYLSVVYSGDAIFSKESNASLEYAVPLEGSNIWYDGMVMLKGTKRKANAERFIDYMCRADVAAKMTDAAGYTTANKAALALLSDSTRLDTTYWPSSDVLSRCEMFLDLGDFKKEYERVWNDVLTSE